MSSSDKKFRTILQDPVELSDEMFSLIEQVMTKEMNLKFREIFHIKL